MPTAGAPSRSRRVRSCRSRRRCSSSWRRRTAREPERESERASRREARRNGHHRRAELSLNGSPVRSARARLADASAPSGSRARALAPLAGILLIYISLTPGYAVGTPRWNNPDEPAHYNYIAHLARTGQLPLLEPGDWDSQRLGERLASGRFSSQEPIESFRYESHQPPLYYALMAPVYRAA